MTPYKPYPIYDMRAGQVTALEPWLLPKDAFKSILNGYLKHGVLEKRRGYSSFTTLSTPETVMGLWNYYKSATPTLLLFGLTHGNSYSPSTGLCTDLNDLQLRFKSGGTTAIVVGNTVTGHTSTAHAKVEAITLDGGSWAGGDAWGTLHVSTQTGTFQAGEDLDVGASLNEASNAEGGNSSTHLFTGDTSQFFWLCNWLDVGYICNGKDVCRKYDNTYLTYFHIDLDVEGGPDNDVNTELMIFKYHGRLVLLRTIERSVAHNQRARWCEINDPTTWPDTNYIDAGSDEYIIGAGILANELIVFFERSIWKLVYTGDANNPFEWDQICPVQGLGATFSVLNFTDELFGVGPTRIIATDGRDGYGIDDRMPNFMLTWNQDKVDRCYGMVIEEEDWAWMSYPEAGQTTCNAVLVFNYEDNAYSTFDIAATCFGSYKVQSDLTWQCDLTWEECDFPWSERSSQAGYPINLMGTTSGEVFALQSGGSDDAAAIAFNVESASWNPFVESGLQADFGWLDLFVDCDAYVDLTVDFYIGDEASPYLTQAITLADDKGGTPEKTWKRIYVGQIAPNHRVVFRNSGVSDRPRIHAIVPYFREAAAL